MATGTAPMVHTAAEALLPNGRPDYDLIITSDGTPVESFYDEKQMRLLASSLYASWAGPGEGRPFLVAANVGLFYSFREPPVVPDNMLSLDVAGDPQMKEYKSYFLWEYGKTPDVVIEIVSGPEGEELDRKRRLYQKIGIPYYIVWDPNLHLSAQNLYCFVLRGRKYEDNGNWLPEVGLGVTLWTGIYENLDRTWLRWCDEQGVLIATPQEKIEREKQHADDQKRRADEAQLRADEQKQRANEQSQRADEEKQRADEQKQRADEQKQRADEQKQRADEQKQRADKLAEKLRAAGIDPDKP